MGDKRTKIDVEDFWDQSFPGLAETIIFILVIFLLGVIF